MAAQTLSYQILGPLAVARDGVSLPIGGRNQHHVLAALLLNAGAVVSNRDLIEAVWGDTVVENPTGALQVCISRLRKVLDPERRGVLNNVGDGYSIRAASTEIDFRVHDDLHNKGRLADESGDDNAAAVAFRNALGLWKGPFLGDVGHEFYFAPYVARYEEARLTASLGALKAELRLGMHADVIAELEQLLVAHPLNEQARRLHMLALYRCERQSDALASYRALRSRLVEELGLEPGPELQKLEHQILNHDPALLSPAELTGFTETVSSTPIPHAMAFLVLGRSRIPITASLITIGRQPDMDVVVPTPDTSRRHAEVQRDGDDYIVKDAGSSNGTTVNGHPLRNTHRLEHGDEIGIGSSVVRFERSA